MSGSWRRVQGDRRPFWRLDRLGTIGGVSSTFSLYQADRNWTTLQSLMKVGAKTNEIERLAGATMVASWTFHSKDNHPGEVAGGYFTGEVVLCSNGIVVARLVNDSFAQNEARLRPGEWKVMERLPRYSDPSVAAADLMSRGYELFPSSPLDIEAVEGWPYAWPPPPARQR